MTKNSPVEKRDDAPVEIEEYYKNGQVVRRYINGIEVEPDAEPTGVQLADYAVIITQMTPMEAKQRFGTRFTAWFSKQQNVNGDTPPQVDKV